MNLFEDLHTAVTDIRAIGGRLTEHYNHVDQTAHRWATSQIGQALIQEAEVLLPGDERMIASVIHALAAIRRHPETALAAPQEPAGSPAPAPEGDQADTGSDGAQDGSEGSGADVTVQDAAVTA